VEDEVFGKEADRTVQDIFNNKEFGARSEVLSVVIMKFIVLFRCDAVYVVDRY
jgi:hypothetical protein